MAEAKWSGVLSTTEPRNDVGIIKVRQGNVNSEVAEFQIVQNNKPYNLTGLTVYFCASFGLNLVEKPAVIVNAAGGRIQYTFDDDSMQSLGRQKGYFSIKKEESKIDSTQDFEYQVESSLMTRSIDGKSYIYKLSALIKILDDFVKNGQKNFNTWFESVKEILYGVDPGGNILRELIEARKNSSGNIFASLKERLDKNEDETNRQLAQTATKNEVDKKRDKATKISSLDVSDELLSMFSPAGTVNPVIPDNSVDALTTTFLKPKKNLFNKAKRIGDYFVASVDGKLKIDNRYDASDWIIVEGGSPYVMNYGGQWAEYDASKNFISGHSSSELSATLNPSTVYVRISVSKSNIDTFQFEKGNVVTAFDEFKLTFTKVGSEPIEIEVNKDEISKDFYDEAGSGVDVENIAENPDFSNGIAGWETINDYSDLSVANNVLTVKAKTGGKVYVGQTDLFTIPFGSKVYVAFDIVGSKRGSGNVAIGTSNFTNITPLSSLSIETFMSRKSFIIENDKSPAVSMRINTTDFTTVGDYVEISNVVITNLSEVYGFGNEPSMIVYNDLLKGLPNNFYKGEVTITKHGTLKAGNVRLDKNNPLFESKTVEGALNELKAPKYELEISAIANNQQGISREKDTYPVMFAVKTSNARENKKPEVQGWLYYEPYEPYNLLYADGKPDNLKKICTWNKSITWNGQSTPENYSPFITRDGDIIFVFRGEQVDDYTSQPAYNPEARQNPIIYPAGDYDNPVVVDFGDRINPTNWLQNSGADFIYSQDVFIFSEYTRTVHNKTYTWKVTKPFTDPDNWKIVQEFDLSGDYVDGMKHMHTANFDPYSGAVYTSTGDDSTAAAIYSSKDYGETWQMEIDNTIYPNAEKYARVLNFIFTENKVYWATDSFKKDMHFLFEVGRDENGYADFSNITELAKLPVGQATYVLCLIDKPNGLLMLDRYDNPSSEPMKVYFWSFETEKLHQIHTIYPLNGKVTNVGFRAEATNFYQAINDKRIVSGFGYRPNENEGLGNSEDDRVYNLTLKVKEV